MAKHRRSARAPSARAPRKSPRWPDQLGVWVLWALVLVPPLVFDPMAKDTFRLPKELVGEALVLASLTLLCLRLRHVERVDWRELVRHPAFLATLPLLAAVTLSRILSDHPLHAQLGWTSIATGGAALLGWSLALSSAERRRLLNALVVPATVLALIAILQSHDVFDPFQVEGRDTARRGVTSLAGGVLDLAAYLVLPALIVQSRLYTSRTPGARLAWGLILCVLLYALARSQTLTAMAALGVSSLVLWAVLLPPRRVVLVVTVLALAGGGLVLGVEPLRDRMERQTRRLSEGRVNDVLTGRLDGWRAAAHIWSEHPVYGVGPGVFTTEFAAAKLELSAQGVQFFDKHFEPHFASAHNEYLELAAECGTLGVLALAWGIFVVLRELARRRAVKDDSTDTTATVSSTDLALMISGAVSLVVLALASFPFHLAIVAYPNLLLLSWILEGKSAPGDRPPTEEAGT